MERPYPLTGRDDLRDELGKMDSDEVEQTRRFRE
jgi:hypothetical protein